jgi:hypothetical protein
MFKRKNGECAACLKKFSTDICGKKYIKWGV